MDSSKNILFAHVAIETVVIGTVVYVFIKKISELTIKVNLLEKKLEEKISNQVSAIDNTDLTKINETLTQHQKQTSEHISNIYGIIKKLSMNINNISDFLQTNQKGHQNQSFQGQNQDQVHRQNIVRQPIQRNIVRNIQSQNLEKIDEENTENTNLEQESNSSKPIEVSKENIEDEELSEELKDLEKESEEDKKTNISEFLEENDDMTSLQNISEGDVNGDGNVNLEDTNTEDNSINNSNQTTDIKNKNNVTSENSTSLEFISVKKRKSKKN